MFLDYLDITLLSYGLAKRQLTLLSVYNTVYPSRHSGM